MALIKSGNSNDHLTIDANNAARITKYTSLGRSVSYQNERAFMISATFTPPATPTDLIKISGSASKVVRVYSIYFGATAGSAASYQLFVLRRASDNFITTATFVMPGVLALDSQDTATAIAGHYITTTPAAAGLGQSIGNINVVRWAMTQAVPGPWSGVMREAGKEILPWMSNNVMDKCITLRGPNQTLCVNHNSVAILGTQTHTYRILWTESDN
jgi:hypothetical protein